ncbi:AAA domain-containing protein [Synechococcus sp. A10-1-5-1]|uniref:AAA domain-containing protein n=1 Tax=Synechococcus sp. A10-1-5-1 TaxID=2936507 RepID=UPI0020016810|nr:AAA domain-containing protein [Synechococcus sp. A10-1-5-1]UPM50133.1 AAA domain-containing protein [Synechococcus sp. A10-1-5-1]
MNHRLIKRCPACGHANDPAEIYCQGMKATGTSCQYNLLDVDPTGLEPALVPDPARANDLAPQACDQEELPLLNGTDHRNCLNGHPLAPTDLLCLLCGAEPAQELCSEGHADPSPAFQLSGTRLSDLSPDERQSTELLRAVVSQVDTLLFNLQRQGRCAPDLSPEQVLLVSRAPFRLSLSPGSERDDFSSGGDLSASQSGATGRHSAPERLVGIQAPSSDWWSLGLTILELLVGPALWQDIHPQAWQLQVITNGVTIPESITDPWRTLLRGLLTRDPQSRWGHSEIIRWLDGDCDIPLLEDTPQGESEGTLIRLAGQRHRSPTRYALAAAQSDAWEESLDQLQQGELLTWLEENNLESTSLAEVRRLAADECLEPDERLMLVLILLNPNLPLCLRGELIGRGTLPANPQRAQAWLKGVLPSRLRRIGRQTWLTDLAVRREGALSQARALGINLDEPRLEAAALVSDRRRLEQAWGERRQEWPAALHNGLSNLISRGRHSEEHLLVLLSAQLEQFRSAADVLKEAELLAGRAKVSDHWDEAAARRWLSHSQREIFEALQEHLADFVRCGLKQPDDWADQFRSDQRLPLEQALLLLSIPADIWIKPEGGEHWQRLLHFFRRRVLSGIQRGPLLALSVRPGGKRVDLAELNTEALPATTLLNHLVGRQSKPRSLDPELLETNPALNQRLRRLRQEADAYQRETGIQALHLGYPLLLKRDGPTRNREARKPKLIPLLLWPVRLGVTAQGNLPQLGYDRDRGSGDGIQLNPALEGVLSVRQFRELKEALEELQQRSALTGTQVIDALGTIFPNGEGVLEPCPPNPSLPDGSDESLVPSGVLFLCSFSAQTLAHELAQLEQRPCLEGPMAALLRLSNNADLTAEQHSSPLESDRFLVTPADPSQKRAVWASRQQPGVLIQGPPGTGKSQTIVNIVADALGRHERVLVVCQKQAALEVVCNRLEAAQLGDRLCLITDPSRDRKPLLRKLRHQLDSWDPTRRRDELSRERIAIATDLTRLENELDGIYRAMATPLLSSGLNDQKVIDSLMQLGKNPNAPALTALRPVLHNCHVEEVRTIARQCADIAGLWLRARPENSPLQVLLWFSVDESTLSALTQAFQQLRQHDRALAADLNAFPNAIESPQPDVVQAWINTFSAILQDVDGKLASLLTIWLPLFSDDSGNQVRVQLDTLARERRVVQEPGAALRWQKVLQPLADADLEAVAKALEIWCRGRSSFLSLLNPAFHRARSLLQQQVPQVMCDDFNLSISLQNSLVYEIQLRGDCRRYESLRRDLGLPQSSANLRQQELLTAVDRLLDQFDQASDVVEAMRNCPLRQQADQALCSGRAEQIRDFVASLQSGVRRQVLRGQCRQSLVELAPWTDPKWLKALEQRITSGEPITAELDSIHESWDSLVDFQRYRSRSATLSTNEHAVMAVLAAKRNHWLSLKPEQLSEAIRFTIEREALLGWQAVSEAQEPALLLTRQDVDRRTKQLATQDARLLELNKHLTATPAAPERVHLRPRWDDVVMLTGPRARKLREVVELGEDRGLFELCPVWLANPETVSQIFPLRQGLFDLVIFDEASQLPVESAIPAMYRANRIVISGDEKQLPPTRFFSSGFIDESDEEIIAEEEVADPDTIADNHIAAETRRQVKDCSDLLELGSAAGLTHVSLDIHYRSRFRALIAHSNAAFYQNKLSIPVLHPADEIRRTRPLQLELVNGTYINQSNRDEAMAVVAFLENLWCGPNTADPSCLPTTGVVTFNKNQADLIEDLLDRFSQETPLFHQALERERQRRFHSEDCGFFVKNLENVQGDERDLILFSTTFGRDESERFLRRFGALGQKGGERRLNVATSRARDKVVIFSSMPIEEISDAHRQRKTPQSPRDFLQSYLLYAKSISDGHLDEAELLLNRLHRSSPSSSAAQSDRSQRFFVQSVSEYLRSKGLTVEVPSAVDAFAFDLAIRNPETGLFAIGIECDPPRHQDLVHARDREIWRPRVLQSSLPQVHRVWSRLWLAEPSKEQRRLNEAVRRALPSLGATA